MKWRIKKQTTLFLIALIAVSVLGLSLYSVSLSVVPTSALHVEGNKIYNASGQQVLLRGVNQPLFADDPDGIWHGSTSWTDANCKAELDAMASWGVNVVRCHLNIQDWITNLPDSHSSIGAQDAIKRLLTFAAERGIYVVLDGYRVTDYWNGGNQDPLPYPPYQTSSGASAVIDSSNDFVDWWEDVADTLKGYNNAIFEIWNEPRGDATAKASFFSVSQQCINAIRGTGAANLIVFQWDMANWVNLSFPAIPGQFFDWIADAGLTDSTGNLVYSTHLYENHIHKSLPSFVYCTSYEDLDAGLDAMGYYDAAAQYPIFIGEVGNTNMEAYENVLELFTEHDLSYAGWVFRTGVSYALISSATVYTPTASGTILKSYLLDQPLPSSTPQPSATPTLAPGETPAPTLEPGATPTPEPSSSPNQNGGEGSWWDGVVNWFSHFWNWLWTGEWE